MTKVIVGIKFPSNPSNSDFCVVGGGLSGLSAAHSVLQAGGNVLVLDKNPFFGKLPSPQKLFVLFLICFHKVATRPKQLPE
jgi:heterodisulfide reductase subunit A-like polyferredoxin